MVVQQTYKVAAYITAYEAPEAVKNCVGEIKKQSYPVEKVFIVDNSKNKPVTSSVHPDAIVDYHPENIGVAGGLRLGVQWAIANDYDFLWAFDQDSELSPNILEQLLTKYEELSGQGGKIGIIAPLPFDLSTQHEIHGSVFQDYRLVPAPSRVEPQDFYHCDTIITSGSLINIKAARRVELPDAGLFLDAVDWSYCLNFKRQGYEIIVLKTAVLKHNLGTYRKVRVRFQKEPSEVVTWVCSPTRYYYACRNHTFFETRNSAKGMLYKSLRHRWEFLREMVQRIVLYESDKVLLKIWACIIGTFDGLRGKLGKTW